MKAYMNKSSSLNTIFISQLRKTISNSPELVNRLVNILSIERERLYTEGYDMRFHFHSRKSEIFQKL